MEKYYETTNIPRHFLYSIFGKYCTNLKLLFLTESTYFHHVPYFH